MGFEKKNSVDVSVTLRLLYSAAEHVSVLSDCYFQFQNMEVRVLSLRLSAERKLNRLGDIASVGCWWYLAEQLELGERKAENSSVLRGAYQDFA